MQKSKKSKATKKVTVKEVEKPHIEKDRRYVFRQKIHNLKRRRQKYLSRRPHRSFRMTKRRDYRRSLKLPGYWSLTKQVTRLIFKNKKIFIGLAVIYAVITFLLASIMTQDTYEQFKDSIEKVSQQGMISGAVSTFAVFWSVFINQVSGASYGGFGSTQQIIGGLFGLFTWLSTIWLLRAILAGKKPRIRDGIYSSGGPVISLLVLAVIILVQILPAALGLIVYGAADASGILSQTAMLMLFGGGLIALIVLSLYWATSTFFAMVIVSLPGMYPMQAIRLAGDIVIGRRIRILLRLVWMSILAVAIWAIVLIPIILLDGAIKSAMPDLSWLPLVPATALGLMSFSIVFSASYIYIFYRKVVEDESAPA